MFTAFISAISNSVAMIFSKVIVSEKNMSGTVFLKVQMLFLTIFMVVPAIIWGSLQSNFFTPKYIVLFIVLITIGVILNILFFTAFSKKKLCEVEPIMLLSTPMTIVLAMIIFPGERSLVLLVISAIAITALLVSRFEKKHLDFDKYSWMIIGFDILCAVEATIIKDLLVVMNATSLYFFRVAFIAIILFLVFRKVKINKVNKKELVQTFVNSGFISIEHVAKFFAIGMIGIVNSSLIILLGPILVLVFSKIFLKEKISLRRGIGDSIVVMCIGAIILLAI